MAAGGGRVEVERRDEEEGGEGDTDSQADRWALNTDTTRASLSLSQNYTTIEYSLT